MSSKANITFHKEAVRTLLLDTFNFTLPLIFIVSTEVLIKFTDCNFTVPLVI